MRIETTWSDGGVTVQQGDGLEIRDGVHAVERLQEDAEFDGTGLTIRKVTIDLDS